MSDFPMMDYVEPEEMEVAADASPLDFLQAVYRDNRQPMPRRMKAAEAALPFVHPKLQVTVDATRNFAALMEDAARRSRRSNVIDAKATPQLAEPGAATKGYGFTGAVPEED
jgi:hypothetical protein